MANNIKHIKLIRTLEKLKIKKMMEYNNNKKNNFPVDINKIPGWSKRKDKSYPPFL